MHAGKVLVSDAPKALIAGRSVETLEDAFIAYMLDAQPAEAAADEGLLTVSNDQKHAKTASRFSIQRMLAFTAREAMQVRRDPVRLVFSFVGSALLLLIMSFGISQEVRNIPFAVFDLDRSPESRAYLSGFQDSVWFSERPPISDNDELNRRMESGELALALQIPPDFGRMVRRGESPEIAALIDGSDTNRAGTVESYVDGAHATILSSDAQETPALNVLAMSQAQAGLLTCTTDPALSIQPGNGEPAGDRPVDPATVAAAVPGDPDGGQRSARKRNRHDHQLLCDTDDPRRIPDRQATGLYRHHAAQFCDLDGACGDRFGRASQG